MSDDKPTPDPWRERAIGFFWGVLSMLLYLWCLEALDHFTR